MILRNWKCPKTPDLKDWIDGMIEIASYECMLGRLQSEGNMKKTWDLFWQHINMVWWAGLLNNWIISMCFSFVLLHWCWWWLVTEHVIDWKVEHWILWWCMKFWLLNNKKKWNYKRIAQHHPLSQVHVCSTCVTTLVLLIHPSVRMRGLTVTIRKTRCSSGAWPDWRRSKRHRKKREKGKTKAETHAAFIWTNVIPFLSEHLYITDLWWNIHVWAFNWSN